MDLRVEKTEKSIVNAFLALRAKKPLEKITVKELCEKALINKSTFYTHYRDLYDLSESLEAEVVESVLTRSGPVLDQPAAFNAELFFACIAQDSLIQILFSGSRSGQFVSKLEKGLKELFFARYPDFRDDAEKNIVLSYLIYGGYYAYDRNRSRGMEEAVPVLGRLAEAVKGVLMEGR